VPEIEDLILKYISLKTAAELSPQHYDEIQSDLLNMINKIMRTGKIKSVVFREFSVVK
jgi:flagellar basal body-associated protein FliL